MRQIEARLYDAKAAKDQIKGELDTSIARYIEIIGEPPSMLESPALPKGALKNSLEDAIHAALHDGPAVKSAEERVKVAEADLDITRSPWYPTLRGEIEARSEHNLEGVQGREFSTSALVVGDWNLYSCLLYTSPSPRDRG